MEKICPTCAADPTSHSFKKISEKNGVVLFYAHPGRAKLYQDSDGIYAHVDRALAALNGRKWSCIIDGDGFEMKHAAEVSLGRMLIELFMKKYAATAQDIRIINPSWHMEGLIKIGEMALKPEQLQKIKLMDDRKRSVLEFL